MLKDTSNDKNCAYGNFKRARYFHGMLMTERDFAEEQNYHNEKRKMLNKMLHGWGVVCGLEIKQNNTPGSTIIIKPGLAIDYNGNEICVSEEYKLNLDKISKLYQCVENEKNVCLPQKGEESENKWYVVIKYKENPSDPVAVYAPAGGCQEKACDYSRIREGYCFDLKGEDEIGCCPGSGEIIEKTCTDYERKKDETNEEYEQRIKTFYEDFLVPCPGKCCDVKYVVLGSIIVRTKCNSVSDAKFEPITQEMINNWDCRKYVMTFGLIQHWMTTLAGKFNTKPLVDYNRWADGCIDPVEFFENYICPTEKAKKYIKRSNKQKKD